MAASILEHSTAAAAPVHLVCTGALTNAALLLLLYPELVADKRIEITLMGGALGIGNTGPVQEFNIMTDPEAARIVFNSGAPITMVPLEVRSQLHVTASGQAERIVAVFTPGFDCLLFAPLRAETLVTCDKVRKRICLHVHQRLHGQLN